MDYEKTLERILSWAREEKTVRTVVLTGSAAEGREHFLSDRDLELHVLDPEALVTSDDWWERLGEVLVVERLENERDEPTRLIYYAGGKLDFTLVEAGFKERKYERPWKVLLDKDGVSASLKPVGFRSKLPSAEEFLECIHWGYAAALMSARAIVREESWSVKMRDHDLKTQLLRMIEWDHLVRFGSDLDISHAGSGMNSWMDLEIRDRLWRCWGECSAISSTGALWESLDLFRDLAERTALDLEIPVFQHDSLRDEVYKILSGSYSS